MSFSDKLKIPDVCGIGKGLFDKALASFSEGAEENKEEIDGAIDKEPEDMISKLEAKTKLYKKNIEDFMPKLPKLTDLPKGMQSGISELKGLAAGGKEAIAKAAELKAAFGDIDLTADICSLPNKVEGLGTKAKSILLATEPDEPDKLPTEFFIDDFSSTNILDDVIPKDIKEGITLVKEVKEDATNIFSGATGASLVSDLVSKTKEESITRIIEQTKSAEDIAKDAALKKLQDVYK